MPLRVTLSQNGPALMGGPTRFTVAVTNLDAVAVENVLAVIPSVTSAAGQPGVPVQVLGPYAAPSDSVASTTNQFNVQIVASGTVYFTFGLCLFAQGVTGAKANAGTQFLVGVTVQDGLNVQWAAPPLVVAMATPGFGQPPGAPPNPSVAIGQLAFSSPLTSAFVL